MKRLSPLQIGHLSLLPVQSGREAAAPKPRASVEPTRIHLGRVVSWPERRARGAARSRATRARFPVKNPDLAATASSKLAVHLFNRNRANLTDLQTAA